MRNLPLLASPKGLLHAYDKGFAFREAECRSRDTESTQKRGQFRIYRYHSVTGPRNGSGGIVTKGFDLYLVSPTGLEPVLPPCQRAMVWSHHIAHSQTGRRSTGWKFITARNRSTWFISSPSDPHWTILFLRQQPDVRRLVAVAGQPAVLLVQLDDLDGTAALLGAVFARLRAAPARMREIK